MLLLVNDVNNDALLNRCLTVRGLKVQSPARAGCSVLFVCSLCVTVGFQNCTEATIDNCFPRYKAKLLCPSKPAALFPAV